MHYHFFTIFVLLLIIFSAVSADVFQSVKAGEQSGNGVHSFATLNSLPIPTIHIFENLKNLFSGVFEKDDEPVNPGVEEETLDLGRINDPEYIKARNTVRGVVPPEGPPYEPLPEKSQGDSDRCPVGKVSFKGLKLGNEFPRYQYFSYKDSPSADMKTLLAGMDPNHVNAVKKICKDFNVNILIRPTNEYAPALLKSGAIPKPEYIKSKTINSLDLKLNNGLTEKDLGKVGYFIPVLPENADSQLKERYDERLKEYQSSYIKKSLYDHINVNQESGLKISLLKNGVVQKITSKGKVQDITGDYDVFDVVSSKTGQPIVDRRIFELIFTRLEKEIGIQHPWQAAWDYRRNPYRKEIEEFDGNIIEYHKKHELIQFSPDNPVSGIFISEAAKIPTEPDYGAYTIGTSYGQLNDEITYGPNGEKKALPVLRNQGLKSKALCRGACGMDCDANRCKPTEEITIVVEGGTCTYPNVETCYSHQGCRDHDACYDWCAELGESSVIGPCHLLCNNRCYSYVQETMDTWSSGVGACAAWAGLTGFEDWVYPTEFDGTILFSDPPVFTPKEEEVPTADTECWECGTYCLMPPMNSGDDYSALEEIANRCGCYDYWVDCGVLPPRRT